MSANIKDVAREAGVSIATVSRFINQNGYVAASTAKKIENAISKLNYQPKNEIRKPSTTKAIGIVFPSIKNPLFSELFTYLESNLKNKGYNCTLFIDNNENHKLEDYVSLILDGQIKGIINSSPLKIDKVNYPGIPIVTFDRNLGPNIPFVSCNNLDGGFKIAKAVVEKGCKKILILSGNRQDYSPITDRIKGMMKVFNYHELEIKTAYTDFEGSEIAKKIQIDGLIKNKKYDAICTTDDITALFVREQAKLINYSPIITGFDGTKFINHLFPELITVRQPTEELANLLTEICLNQIENYKENIEKKYILPVELVNK
ncbi:LacI family DNA-binding transcriptional regulator [Lactobacillus mulieris]|uniref:LacI family transcriptional regulator n=1 Tax=Lactobacillus mulieris TaxID=2508708 RepID=A0AAP3GX34_9LACO|nr:LacI family DNA-binding transcriptional regulator [Lactobacillus mulieris]MCZ3845064.1 LacI family transcriptional regulator [Lactobacillus mulieris]MCZ3876918.1 LacI family transcriptional regulator [Lactobacillus mulieris]MCZ3900345.1 LacI family transcriptional regulator [Lactobacillus mulieris]